METAVPSFFTFSFHVGYLTSKMDPTNTLPSGYSNVQWMLIIQRPLYFLFLPLPPRLPPHPAPGHAPAHDVIAPVRRGAALTGRPAFARCCRRRRRRPRLLSQDGGSSGRVLQRWEPGVVPDVPGAAAAGRGGSLRLPVQNAGFKYPSVRGARGRAGVYVRWWKGGGRQQRLGPSPGLGATGHRGARSACAWP